MTDKALAARLREHARMGGDPARCVDAADLIEKMAQRVPLSDEQIDEIWLSIMTVHHTEQARRLARAIEQSHGIRSEK